MKCNFLENEINVQFNSKFFFYCISPSDIRPLKDSLGRDERSKFCEFLLPFEDIFDRGTVWLREHQTALLSNFWTPQFSFATKGLFVVKFGHYNSMKTLKNTQNGF